MHGLVTFGWIILALGMMLRFKRAQTKTDQGTTASLQVLPGSEAE